MHTILRLFYDAPIKQIFSYMSVVPSHVGHPELNWPRWSRNSG